MFDFHEFSAANSGTEAQNHSLTSLATHTSSESDFMVQHYHDSRIRKSFNNIQYTMFTFYSYVGMGTDASVWKFRNQSSLSNYELP